MVLALYPRVVSNDPGRLDRLAGEMERAAQLFHPNILPPASIEEVGEDLAALTVWRDAVTLRELLDAGGALPHEIAARIAVDVCAGLAHAHGRPEPVVHGLLRPEAVLLDENGVAMVSGFGVPGGSGVADDVLGVGELLHECLTGEPPDDPSVPLAGSEAPPALVVAVNRARAPRPEGRPPGAEALAEAIGQAVPPASHDTVAAYVNAVLPAKSGVRAERREKIAAALAAPPFQPQEISDDDIFADAFPADEAGGSDLPSTPAAAGNGSGAGGPSDPSPPVPDVAAPSIDLEDPPSPEPSSEAEAPTPPPPEPPDTTLRVELSAPAAKPRESSRRATPASTRKPASIPTPPATAPVAESPRPSPADEPEREDSPREELGEREDSERDDSLDEDSRTEEEPERKDAPVKPPAREERAPRGRGPSLAAAILLLLVGAVGGFALAVLTPWRELARESLRHAAEALAPDRPAETAAAPKEARAPVPPAPAEEDADASADDSPSEPSEEAATPAPAPVRRTSASVREKSEKKRSRVRQRPAAADNAASEPASSGSGMGFLVVAGAPADTEVWLDGRRVGTGDLRKQISEGNHRVEVRRGGAKAGEKFHVEAGETWTYTITAK